MEQVTLQMYLLIFTYYEEYDSEVRLHCGLSHLYRMKGMRQNNLTYL